MKHKQLIAVLLCAVTSFAYAEMDALDEVVVTATRVAQPLDRSLVHTTVISRKEILASQAADVPTLLKGLAGVEVYQSGGIGKQSSLFMRGTNSSHALVLLDGVRVGSATSGMTAIDQLMLDQIERIEVVRGNISSLYGSEGIGGVIQVFTRRGKGAPAFNVGAEAGSRNTQRISAGFGGEAGETSFGVQVSGFKTEGVSSVKPTMVPTVNPDRDGYRNASFSASVRQSFGADHSLSFSLFDSSANSQTDNSFGLRTDVNESQANVRKMALTMENHFGDIWQSRLQLSQGVDDTQNFLNGVPDIALGAQFKTVSDQIAWQNMLQLGAHNVLNVGVEQLKQRVSSSTAFTRTRRTDDSVFAGYTGIYGAHQLQLNLRRDRYSDFGKADTALLGYGYDLNDAWRITASTGTAFKAPTLNDLFYPFVNYGFGFSYVGNPNLKPERSRNNELGLHYTADGQRADIVYFDNRINDLIVNNNLPASTMINLGKARIDGIEMEYAGQFGNTDAKMSLTLQNPRDAATGQALLRRARSFASIGIMQRIGSWSVGGEWRHSGARADIDINTFARTTLAAYDVADITARYALGKQFDLSLRVDNLFNRDYMLAHGYNTLGRTLFVGVNYRQ
ncbi:MAG: TonB-dependent receptor [Nitrosomonadales bacterium]|nr:TonB-dependent receptor [Nitrosomonadales bacterium]